MTYDFHKSVFRAYSLFIQQQNNAISKPYQVHINTIYVYGFDTFLRGF